MKKTISIFNRKTLEFELLLEPEGDVVLVPPGHQVEIKCEIDEQSVVEFEVEDERVVLHCMSRKTTVIK